ncbi:hypothetical protein [Nonomuraea pusilla]|uniref:Uncharacterized protein n=1 Tax=Nonomuraea pusilla TaxID=46177 RepID=A0A1H7ZW00_9ACTN|nr:hypothetical protein [Nonomuraea pusilla]SEM62625.1 hypothetical protein SAMN05660976_05651 [Nonomuraea pusilla]
MRLPRELRGRLAEIRGDLLHGRLTGSVTDAGWLACDLIAAGVDTPTLLELAGHTLSVGTLREVEPLVRRMLSECGMPPIDTCQEPWAVALDVAQAVHDGTLPVSAGADLLIVRLMPECGHPPEIMEFMLLIDDWEALRGVPPTGEELRSLAGRIADVARAHLPGRP